MFNNIKKNVMGTISFDAKFGKMRKEQDFIVYPIQKDGDTNVLRVQSGKRWAEINIQKAMITLSANHNYANSLALSLDIARGKAEYIQVTTEDLKPLLEAIRTTASPMAGNNAIHLYCDNSKANLV